MTHDLIVVCPSHRRPKEASEVFDTFLATRTADSLLRFGVWTADPSTGGYVHLPVTYSTAETMTARSNILARWAVEQARYVGWIADDNRFRTKGWDRVVIDALEAMGGGVVYGNDVVSPGSKPSHVFMSSEIVRELGWLIHPEMTMTFFDDAWERLGRAMGRLRYLPEVTVEHLYTERDNLAAFVHDKAVYEPWLRHECEDQAARCLRAVRRAVRSRPSSSTSTAERTFRDLVPETGL